jgi:CheY-like chemotaxis protein
MTVDELGHGGAAVTNKPGDLLDRHPGIRQHRHERVPQLPRRPLGRIDTRDQGQRAAEATDGLAKLTGLAHGGEQVALVAADLHLPDGDGVESLERAAGLHNGVARILLFDLDEFHTRIPFRELPALQRASALGRIDSLLASLTVTSTSPSSIG